MTKYSFKNSLQVVYLLLHINYYAGRNLYIFNLMFYQDIQLYKIIFYKIYDQIQSNIKKNHADIQVGIIDHNFNQI